MRSLIRERHVACSLTGERTNDRLVGTCYVGDTDLTAAMIRRGCAPGAPATIPAERYLPAQRETGTWRLSMPGYCN